MHTLQPHCKQLQTSGLCTAEESHRKITLAVRIGLCVLSTDTETHIQHSTQILFCGSHFTWSLAVQYSAPTRSKKTKVNNFLNLQAEAKLLWRSMLPNHLSYRIFFVMDERSGYNFDSRAEGCHTSSLCFIPTLAWHCPGRTLSWCALRGSAPAFSSPWIAQMFAKLNITFSTKEATEERRGSVLSLGRGRSLYSSPGAVI